MTTIWPVISHVGTVVDARPIVTRTTGSRHGPITRLMSPGDFGKLVKPFVFLDLFEADMIQGRGFPPHPHSGIATLTVFLEGRMTYADTTGKTGMLTSGAVEWMQAGGGVWHAGEPAQGGLMRGYQLWLALPPELELSPAKSQYFSSDMIEAEGSVRVVLGQYDGKVSPINLPLSITYLHVKLENGARWVYQPAADHQVAWLALNTGKLHAAGNVLQREMAVFAEGNEPIEMVAEGVVELVIGSAAKHPYPLVTGYYSIHTNQAALVEGEANIARLEKSESMRILAQPR